MMVEPKVKIFLRKVSHLGDALSKQMQLMCTDEVWGRSPSRWAIFDFSEKLAILTLFRTYFASF